MRSNLPLNEAPLSAAGGRGEGPGEGPAVRIAALTKQYGGLTAIGGLDLSVQRGELLAVLGPSGCGKSTLLRILAGLERPTGGTVTLAADSDAAHSRTATVFQGVSLFPWYTVLQNTAYPLWAAGTGKREREERARAALARVGLEDFTRSYPAQLSEGMRQRVAIARALVSDAAILLLDEPFSALDEPTRLLLQEELQEILARTGQTALFVTHSIDEAVLLGGRVAVLSARPATLRAEFSVPFARPRRYTDVRKDPRFGELAVAVWDVLRAEVATQGSRVRSPESGVRSAAGSGAGAGAER